jgi:membrane protein implicated in regulation of membrane protease activity
MEHVSGDPLDQQQIRPRREGSAVKIVATSPALLLIVLGLALLAVGVAGLSHRHFDGAVAAIVTAIASAAVGSAGLVRRLRRRHEPEKPERTSQTTEVAENAGSNGPANPG